jgi:uncharacterized FlaG/YvyC family protein
MNMSLQSVSAVTSSPALTSDSVTGKPALPQVELPKIEFKTASKQDYPDLQSAIDDANNMLAYVRPDIKFVIDEATNDVVIMLVEPETGDVINRYPTEQALAISNAIVESQARAAEQHAVFQNAGNGILGLFVAQKI